MWWQLAISAAQIAGGISANAREKATARQNAQFVKMENMEALRRMDREQRFRLGSAMAQMGAGGVLNAGSAAAAIKGLEDEYARQREWAVQAGEQRRRMALKGSGVGDAAILQGLTTAAYGFTSPGDRNKEDDNLFKKDNGKMSSGWWAQSIQKDNTLDYNQRLA